MPTASIRYQFTQRFRVPARKAYRWCTDYEPKDLALMHEKGHREIRKVTSDTIILRETVRQNRKQIKKIKLVKLNPARLSWYNIQIAGPNKHSAFLYEIVSEGKASSRLNFTGLLVVYSKGRLAPQRIRRIASRERRYDSSAWKLLAKAMMKDYTGTTRRA
jgi:hypothetical protein